MKVLITGSAGYVGSAILQHLKCEVVGLNRGVCDLTNREQVAEFFKDKTFDVVIHCAAKIGGRGIAEDSSMFYDNVKMYYNLFEHRTKFKRFINIGSGAEHYLVDTPYGLSKKVIADSVSCFDNFYNLRVYGLFDENEKPTRFIKTCIKSALEGKVVNIHDRHMDFMYMDDFLQIIDHYVYSDIELPDTFECVYGNNTYLSDIAAIVKKLKYLVYYVDGYDTDYVSKSRNLYPTFGYIGLEEGIKRVYNKSISMGKSNLTVVTGLWNMGREERDFDTHYLTNLRLLLDAPCNLFIFIEDKYKDVVWESKVRTQENTFVKIYELQDVKNLYSPFWDRTQAIRTDPEWVNQVEWLEGSPQARLEWYNPVVQSKIFMMHDVTIWNPFQSKYFMWLDAGLTNTVQQQFLTDPTFYRDIVKYIDPFLFLSFEYIGQNQIHGLRRDKMKEYAGQEVEHVCRGGLFAGTKRSIEFAHNTYYGLLGMALEQRVMGTEESIFAIMSYLRPNFFRRYELPGSMISSFVEAVINGEVKLTGSNIGEKEYDEERSRTALYVLTFNKPKQLEEQLLHFQTQNPDWMGYTSMKYVIDNTEDKDLISENYNVCSKYGWHHLSQGKNTGIYWGRKRAAEHFDSLDADFYMFFEDDMKLNGISDITIPDFCRSGFRTKVPMLWDKIHNIMVKDDLDFMKLTFSEVFIDNHQQVSWYNVSDEKRRQYWPKYHKLPVHNFDPQCPRTRYNKIDGYEDLSYAVGECYYCNWPIIMNKRGNKKVFLEEQPDSPSERAMMALVFEKQVEGSIKSAVLLASTITHGRSEHYEQKDRKEG